MNSRKRILAEAKMLAIPWCVVLFGAVLHTWSNDTTQFVEHGVFSRVTFAAAGWFSKGIFWFMTPLLATTPLAMELQNGTLSNLLLQPIERRRIWAEKQIAPCAAVFSAAAVYGYFWRDEGLEVLFIGGAWAVLTLCWASFSILVSRSAHVGIPLTFLLPGAVVLASLPPLRMAQVMGAEISATVVGTVVVLFCGGSGFWLGRRQMERFQFRGAGSTAEVRAPRLLGDLLIALLGAGPRSATANLVRREICLLWPVWTMTASGSVAVVLLAAAQELWTVPDTVIGFFVGLPVAMAVWFSGIVSLEQEFPSGTHTAHLTQPVSVRLLWAVKLEGAAVSAFLSTAAVLGLMAAVFDFSSLGPDALLARNPFGFVFLLAAVAAFASAAVLSASALTGSSTPRVTLMGMLPVFAVALAAHGVGDYLGRLWGGASIWDFLIGAVRPFPLSVSEMTFLRQMSSNGTWTLAWFGGVVLPVTAFLAYRRFRREPPHVSDNPRSLLSFGGPLLPSFAVVFAASFLGGLIQEMPYALGNRVQERTRDVLVDIAAAVNAEVGAAAPVVKPFRVDIRRLEQRTPSSAAALGWIAASTLTLEPAPPPALYTITVPLEGGWTCVVGERISPANKSAFFCESPEGSYGAWSRDR